MTEKHGSPIETLGDDKKRKGSRSQGFRKAKDSRSQGFKGSSGKGRRQNTEVRSQGKVRGFAKHLHL